MYKKCAQLVQTTWQKSVYVHPHNPQQYAVRGRMGWLMHQTAVVMQNRPRIITKLIHNNSSPRLPVEQWLYPISPAPTTTITIYN